MAAGLLYEMMRRLSNMSRSSPTLLDEAGWLQGLQGRKVFDSIEKHRDREQGRYRNKHRMLKQA
jgi:hypothetical protein